MLLTSPHVSATGRFLCAYEAAYEVGSRNVSNLNFSQISQFCYRKYVITTVPTVIRNGLMIDS